MCHNNFKGLEIKNVLILFLKSTPLISYKTAFFCFHINLNNQCFQVLLHLSLIGDVKSQLLDNFLGHFMTGKL